MYKVDPLKKHSIIDMSTTANEIYRDPDGQLNVHVIKVKNTDQILAVIQGKYLDIC